MVRVEVTCTDATNELNYVVEADDKREHDPLFIEEPSDDFRVKVLNPGFYLNRLIFLFFVFVVRVGILLLRVHS